MAILDVHERLLDCPKREAAPLIDGLASDRDLLWPHERWPPMVLEPGLEVGAEGGHGPIRYTVTTYDPGETVVFRFTGPKGFDGSHGFTLVPESPTTVTLKHTLVLRPKGRARLTWPLVYKPLHDALIEDAFDKAEKRLGTGGQRNEPWSMYVRLLRAARL